MTIQIKATEQYFPVVLFIMLYKVVLTFESVNETLKCDHSNKRYGAVLSCGAVKVVATFAFVFHLSLSLNWNVLYSSDLGNC